MSPCSPNDVSIPIPDGPGGSPIPGFGTPFALKLPNVNPFPDGFPEDLLDLLDKLQLLVPPGALKPSLNPNYGKDVFDGIMKLLDQFFPFLMLYKFFLPILNIIICVIEVLCAIPNPFKLIRAIKRLFRRCIPEFLNIFPIFALIIMIISLLLLLLALIEYLIVQIVKFVKIILRNIIALTKAFNDDDDNTVLAMAKKLGSVLCIFQNLFVLFAIFNIIINIIRDMLSLIFSIPPCDDGDPGDADGCCTPDVCPAIVKGPYTNTTGTFKYLNNVQVQTSLVLSPLFGNFNFPVRPESWQIYDLDQTFLKQFRNIFDAYDVTISPKPVFFPTDVTYTAATNPKQAAYTLDLRLYYNPINWGRAGTPRFIRFKKCIMMAVPTTNLVQSDNSIADIYNGVATLGGGLGYEDNGTTILTGFATDGITPIGNQATLENFIHQPAVIGTAPIFSPFDGYTFSNVEYTFTPILETLVGKNLITIGCVPDVALDKNYVNNVIVGDMGIKIQLMGELINSASFPNPGAAQECMAAAVSALRANLSTEGVAQFQTTVDLCLQKLKDDTHNALGSLIGIGFDPCKSDFSVTPNIQFTSKPIAVTVDLKETNGLPLVSGISPEVAINLAARIKGFPTFGEMDNFVYDGYTSFTSNIRSKFPGSGQLTISFDNNIFCTNTIPTDITIPPTHDLKTLDYQFVYTPAGDAGIDGKPRRDEGDVARDGIKDGI